MSDNQPDSISYERRSYDVRLEQINKQLENNRAETVTKIDHLSNKMEMMATSVSELAQVIAKKEVSDQHIKESQDELKSEIKKMRADIDNLKLASKGDETMRKLFWVVLVLGVTGVVGALFGLVIVK